MKKCILLILICISLIGCQHDDLKGTIDLKGVITEIDQQGNRILMDDTKTGLTWVSLPDNIDIKKYKEGQEVVVWTDGKLAESSPQQAKALNIELTTPSQ